MPLSQGCESDVAPRSRAKERIAFGPLLPISVCVFGHAPSSWIVANNLFDILPCVVVEPIFDVSDDVCGSDK